MEIWAVKDVLWVLLLSFFSELTALTNTKFKISQSTEFSAQTKLD